METLTREDRVQELAKEVKDGVAMIQDSEDWKRCLDINSKFWKYSFGNQMLIAIQKPNATRVAGFQTWKGLDRCVKKGEHGIRILAPLLVKVKDKDEQAEEEAQRVLKGFRTVSVFDLSQTEGKELPTVHHPLNGEAPDNAYLKVKSFIEAQGYTVRFEKTDPHLYGYLNKQKEIVLKEGESFAQTLDTLCHEMAHALLGHLENKELSKDEKELEAETTAWIICRNLGLETREASFAYLATWAQGEERDLKLERAAHRACAVAKNILTGLEERALTNGKGS